MKTTIERSKLLKTLVHVQSIVEQRNTIPILSNIVVEARDGRLHLTSTDLDMQVVDSTEAEVATPGKTTIGARTLLDIVRKLPDGTQVQLSAAEGRMAVTAGRSRFSLPTLPADDFPSFPEVEMEHEMTLTTDALERAFQRTRFAMSSEETRYYLNGIFLHVPNDSLVAAATDGHRLSKVKVDTAGASLAGFPPVIMPRKAVGEIVKLLGEFDGEIDMSVSRAKMRFRIGTLTLTTKTIDGTFPDYQRVIPATHRMTVSADAKKMIEATDRVSTIATEKTRAVKMDVSSGTITMSVTSPENGTAKDDLQCETDGDIEIGFNSRYLTDALSFVDSANVRLHMNDAAAPVLVVDETRPDDAMVLMPMRV